MEWIVGLSWSIGRCRWQLCHVDQSKQKLNKTHPGFKSKIRPDPGQAKIAAKRITDETKLTQKKYFLKRRR